MSTRKAEIRLCYLRLNLSIYLDIYHKVNNKFYYLTINLSIANFSFFIFMIVSAHKEIGICREEKTKKNIHKIKKRESKSTGSIMGTIYR